MTLPSTPLLEGEPPAEVGRGECVTSRADCDAPPPLKTNKNDAESGAAVLLCTLKVSMRNAQCCGGGYRAGRRGSGQGSECLAAVFRTVGRAVRGAATFHVCGFIWVLGSTTIPMPRVTVGSRYDVYQDPPLRNFERLRASVGLSTTEKGKWYLVCALQVVTW